LELLGQGLRQAWQSQGTNKHTAEELALDELLEKPPEKQNLPTRWEVGRPRRT
jgi:hypothetical protein